MPCEGVVQAPRRRADVQTLVRVGDANDVDACLALQRTHPIGIWLTAFAELAVRGRRAVAWRGYSGRDERRRPWRGHALPRREVRRRVDSARPRAAIPNLEVQMFEVLAVERARADGAEHLAGAHDFAALHRERREVRVIRRPADR